MTNPNLEDRIRDALAADAETVVAAPDAWARFEAAAREVPVAGPRRRRGLALGGGAAALAAAAAVAIVLAAGDEPAHEVRLVPGTTTPTSAPEPTTTTAVPGGRPESIVAATEYGRVVRLSSATGAVEQVLVEGRKTVGSKSFGGLAVDPLGGRVFYDDDPHGDGPGEIWSVRLDGTDRKKVADGTRPAVDQTGKSLAYARTSGDGSIAVRNLATGAERVIGPETTELGDPLPWVVEALTWSAAPSGELYVELDWEGSGGIVELAPSARSLADGRKILPPDTAPEGTWWEHPAGWLSGVVAVETCCLEYSEDDPLGSTDYRVNRLVYAGHRSGAPAEELVRLPAPVKALSASPVASGQPGRMHVVFVADGAVWTWSGGEAQPRKVAEGYVAADW